MESTLPNSPYPRYISLFDARIGGVLIIDSSWKCLPHINCRRRSGRRLEFMEFEWSPWAHVGCSYKAIAKSSCHCLWSTLEQSPLSASHVYYYRWHIERLWDWWGRRTSPWSPGNSMRSIWLHRNLVALLIIVNQLLTGKAFDLHCHSNLTRAVLPYHLTEFDVHDVLNVVCIPLLPELITSFNVLDWIKTINTTWKRVQQK